MSIQQLLHGIAKHEGRVTKSMVSQQTKCHNHPSPHQLKSAVQGAVGAMSAASMWMSLSNLTSLLFCEACKRNWKFDSFSAQRILQKAKAQRRQLCALVGSQAFPVFHCLFHSFAVQGSFQNGGPLKFHIRSALSHSFPFGHKGLQQAIWMETRKIKPSESAVPDQPDLSSKPSFEVVESGLIWCHHSSPQHRGDKMSQSSRNSVTKMECWQSFWEIKKLAILFLCYFDPLIFPSWLWALDLAPASIVMLHTDILASPFGNVTFVLLFCDAKKACLHGHVLEDVSTFNFKKWWKLILPFRFHVGGNLE